MAYSLHIQSSSDSIELSDWIEAVTSTKGARLNSSGVTAVNPDTGEEIMITGNEGDVEVLFNTGGFLGFGKSSSWEVCINFVEGKASFNATENIESAGNPVRIVASVLAKKLSAQIVGDEGETYNW